MTIRRALILIVVLHASPAFGQIEECAAYQRFIDQIVAGTDRTAALVDVGQTTRCVAIFAAGLGGRDRIDFMEFVKRFESSRADKQSGTTAGGTGSTSVVAQGPVAKVLSFAAEHGALTQSVSDQIVTVRGNLAGLPSALLRQNVFPYCAGSERLSGYCIGNSVLSALRRVSFGVSFDPTRGDDPITATPAGGDSGPVQPVTFTADRREIASASVRVEIWNKRDVTSPEFVAAWKERVGAAMDAAATDLLTTGGDFATAIMDAPGYDAWHSASAAKVKAAGQNRAALVAALRESLDALLPIIKSAVPDYETRAAAALAAYSRFFLAQDELIDSLAMKNVLAFEYTNDHPAGQVATSQFRTIADLPLTPVTKLVVNGAFSLYHSVPDAAGPEVKRFRDARVGLQIDHALGNVSILGPATASVALYYQNQRSAVLLEVDPANPIPNVAFSGLPENATHVFTNTGNIWLAQAKLSVAPPNSSVKIPLAVTYSNRTELVDSPTWSGQVGVTYDFDGLLALLGAGRP
jgi:hypothetical protein